MLPSRQALKGLYVKAYACECLQKRPLERPAKASKKSIIHVFKNAFKGVKPSKRHLKALEKACKGLRNCV